jgi:site-specific recombinase XerD
MATRAYLTTDQEHLVLSAIRDWKLRDRSLLEFGLRTGYRARELASITIAQVWDGVRVRDEVSVARCHLKNGRGLRRGNVRSRTVPLGPSPREILHAYLQERVDAGTAAPEAPLFLSTQAEAGIGRWMINQLVKRACRAAGLPQHGRWGSHSLRKSFARRVYTRSGHEINLTRAALGHRDIATTQRYLEVNEGDLRAAILGAA